MDLWGDEILKKINQEEYEVLKELDDKWEWIARDSNASLWAYKTKPRRCGGSIEWEDPVDGNYHYIYTDQFNFARWEDEEPYSIAELVEEYENSAEHEEMVELPDVLNTINQLDEVLEREYATYDEGSDIETLAKTINWALVDLEGLDALCIYRLKDATDFIVESLVELVKRKKEIEELKEEVEESREKRFIIPLPGLITTDGEQQYLTYKDDKFFVSRRDEDLRQIWKRSHLDFVPEVYREFAVEFEEGMKY